MRIEGNFRDRRARTWAHRRLWQAGCILSALCLAGCTAAHYKRSADKETYGAIEEKSWQVTNMEPHFTIEQTNALDLDGLPQASATNDFLGEASQSELGAWILPLDKSLAIAVKHSRVYQNSREQLYLSALSLTLVRHQFTPLFSASGDARYEGVTAQTVALVPDPVTGNPVPVLSDNLMEKHDVRADVIQKVLDSIK
jgi:hypothetical protein